MKDTVYKRVKTYKKYDKIKKTSNPANVYVPITQNNTGPTKYTLTDGHTKYNKSAESYRVIEELKTN